METKSLMEALVQVTHQLIKERMALQDTNNSINILKKEKTTVETGIQIAELKGVKEAQDEKIKNLTSMKNDIESSIGCLETSKEIANVATPTTGINVATMVKDFPWFRNKKNDTTRSIEDPAQFILEFQELIEHVLPCQEELWILALSIKCAEEEDKTWVRNHLPGQPWKEAKRLFVDHYAGDNIQATRALALFNIRHLEGKSLNLEQAVKKFCENYNQAKSLPLDLSHK